MIHIFHPDLLRWIRKMLDVGYVRTIRGLKAVATSLFTDMVYMLIPTVFLQHVQPCLLLLFFCVMYFLLAAVLPFNSYSFVVFAQVLNVHAVPGICLGACRWSNPSAMRPCCSPKSWCCKGRYAIKQDILVLVHIFLFCPFKCW